MHVCKMKVRLLVNLVVEHVHSVTYVHASWVVGYLYPMRWSNTLYSKWGDRILCILNVGDYDVLLASWDDDLLVIGTTCL